MTQELALELLKSGKNIFLTGSAGTGKTYVLNQFIKHLKTSKVKVAVTASTGIAATHISGSTIHSWSGIGIKQLLSSKDLAGLKKKKYLTDQFKKAKVLIIDEISMLHREQLDSIHNVLSYCLGDTRAFGGLQVVLCGDFFQLPPIGKQGETSRDRFAFMSNSWLYAGFNICYLTEQYRQSNNKLTEILDEIRSGSVSAAAIAELNKASETTFDEKITPTKLYTHNEDVDRINNEHLADIPGMSKIFNAKTKGEKALIDTLNRSVLTHDRMAIKIGAKVMFVKNNPEKGYINGTLGEVIDYSDDNYPIVRTFDDLIIEATREEWSILDDNEKTLASYKQVPLRLAWAITVHKSQGMTLDAAELDLGRTFEMGQGYVALSRLKALENLKLLNFNARALEVDKLALKADQRFQELSEELAKNTDLEELVAAQKAFITGAGGRRLKKLGTRPKT
ncbi:MAG: ATP-dependent exoDNAse (exonuclease V) alpha subunit [Flavobacteriales bacterium]|jgi:ATP-dependent exoDNAse (exonuclease V) alpha subunit